MDKNDQKCHFLVGNASSFMVHFPATVTSEASKIRQFFRRQEDSQALPIRIDNVTWQQQQQHGWWLSLNQGTIGCTPNSVPMVLIGLI